MGSPQKVSWKSDQSPHILVKKQLELLQKRSDRVCFSLLDYMVWDKIDMDIIGIIGDL